MEQRNRKRINEPRGAYELRCECGKPGQWLMWLDQLDGDGHTQRNYVPLCADCLAMERADNPSRIEVAAIPCSDGDTLQSATRSAVRQWMAENPPAEIAQIAAAMSRTYKAVWGVVRRMSLSGEVVAVDTRTTSNGVVVNIWGLK